MARKQRYIFVEEKPHHFRAFLLGVLVVAFLAALGLFIYNYGLSHQVVAQRQSVTIPNLSGDLENWSILHMSDLHGKYLGQGHASISRAISGRSYSCAVFTGDMLGKNGDVKPLLDLVALLPDGMPKLFIPGDSDPPLIATTAHASLSPYADWAVQLQEAGVTILDEPVSFTRNRSTIWFIPEELYTLDINSTEAAYQAQLDLLNASLTPLDADDAALARAAEYNINRMRRLRETRQVISENDIQIAVAHKPLTAEYISEMVAASDPNEVFSLRHVSLVLAGHYTAGQWRLPGMGAIWVPELGFFPEDSLLMGLDYFSGVPQYISPGLAASDFYPMPGRLFNVPVITTIYLTANIV